MLWKQYQEMRDANTIGADKYFHCVAHCNATSLGDIGEFISDMFGELREWLDENVKGDPRAACDADREANKRGRRGAGKNCKEECAALRPRGLSNEY
jgi:hypothetical protein